jgi:hypothetical protein
MVGDIPRLKNLRHYEGGNKDWMKHDLPVEGERSES